MIFSIILFWVSEFTELCTLEIITCKKRFGTIWIILFLKFNINAEEVISTVKTDQDSHKKHKNKLRKDLIVSFSHNVLKYLTKIQISSIDLGEKCVGDKMLKFLFFSSVVLAQGLQCNSTACPYPDDWKAVLQVQWSLKFIFINIML